MWVNFRYDFVLPWWQHRHVGVLGSSENTKFRNDCTVDKLLYYIIYHSFSFYKMGFTVLRSLLSLILLLLFKPCRPYDVQIPAKSWVIRIGNIISNLGCFLGFCNQNSLTDLPNIFEAQQRLKCWVDIDNEKVLVYTVYVCMFSLLLWS